MDNGTSPLTFEIRKSENSSAIDIKKKALICFVDKSVNAKSKQNPEERRNNLISSHSIDNDRVDNDLDKHCNTTLFYSESHFCIKVTNPV